MDDLELAMSEGGSPYAMGRECIYRKQQELSVLCQKTLFTKREIKILYWGWKVACPDGILDERTFKEIYAQFFPQAGDASLYAHFVFQAMFMETLARNHGQISFLDYACALSVLCRGTMEDKIKWMFKLYDINMDGKITLDEVLQISIATFALLGSQVMPVHNFKTYEEHARKVFKRLDREGKGAISFEAFRDVCLNDETIFHSIQQLDTSTI